MIADTVRVLALLLVVVAASSFPFAVHAQGRPRSAWLAVIGAEVMFVSAAATIAAHWGQPLVWYRTPLIAAASALFVWFSVEALIRWR